MTRLAENSWGKSAVRVSKVHPDGFLDVSVQVLLQGEVEAAYLEGDNSAVVPTDTMRNTVYGFAQEHLGPDLESFAGIVAAHFLAKAGVDSASVSVEGRRWQRISAIGFTGGSSERRVARVEASSGSKEVVAGIEGLSVLKTTKSAFEGFPRDEYTALPEKQDRLLATTISASWRYDPVPPDTAATWERVRQVLLERFFEDWSASVQHQGWQMADAVLAAVPEIAEIDFRLPNQHHLGFELGRFGVADEGTVFQPVTEPYGDIRFTVRR